MKVKLIELISMFDDLIDRKQYREEIANWAVKRRQAEDEGNLEYEPISAEDIIWEGILYLTGCDMKDSPTSYLHSIKNFGDKKKSLFGKKSLQD
ncbi:MAG: hypothetical protein AAGA60_23430 [Cyanobacteria bacterium P01_E01_bin.42]